MMHALRRILAAVALAPLAACVGLPVEERADRAAETAPASAAAPVPWASGPLLDRDQGPWQHMLFPGKRATQFRPVRVDGRDALSATAIGSASMVRKKVRIDPGELGRMTFSWKVQGLIASADMARREADDSPVRVVLAFEGDRRKWSARDAMLSELARAVTGEEMPYATLMYVWCNQRAPGSVILNPRTDRIRKMVVESGPAGLGRWLEYERDVRADFRAAFGEEPGPLVAVGVMSDSDNTQSTVHAWYGPVRMLAAPVALR